jgi:hypothetical protein
MSFDGDDRVLVKHPGGRYSDDVISAIDLEFGTRLCILGAAASHSASSFSPVIPSSAHETPFDVME